MPGFFTSSDLQRKFKVEVDPENLQSDCDKCGLDKNCLHPKIGVSGEGKKKILIIGEFPSLKDDRYGVHYVGEAGDLLKKKLKENGILLNSDCWKTAVIRCIPENNKPSQAQIKHCYPEIEKIIKQLKPKLILLFGSLAVTSLFGEDYSNRKIERWRRYCIPDERFNCNIIPLYNPTDLIKNEKDKNLQKLFDRDLKYAVRCLNRKVIERKEYESYVTTLTDFKRVKTLLKRIIKRKITIAYDYETTGLKPFKKGHKVVTIGIAVSATKAFAFPYQWKQFWLKKEFKVIRNLWQQILADDKIDKIAHNSKFEEVWSTVIFNRRPNCHFDTMMCEHILDNRSASTGLKFQSFVHYGIRPYDKTIAPFLKAKDGEFNTIEKAPLKDILIYNGLDVIFTYMRYNDQIKIITKNNLLLKAYNFFMRGNKQMATIQMNGICMNSNYYTRTELDLQKKVDDRKEYLTTGREARSFAEKYNREIKITSNQDLGKLFYEVLGKKPIYTNEKQINYRTDKTTLESLNLPFVDKLLEMKKYEKANGTYLGQFAREIYRGKMYPFFDLNIPVTYRGSSLKPNFQNLPARDAEIKRLIRMGIIPNLNCVLSEIDFSGSEVITSATYHKDPTFIHDITVGDMHRDFAIELWQLPPDMMDKRKNPSYTDAELKMIKDIRFFAKNDWTFAQLYGDWFGSCGKMLWEDGIDSETKLPNGMNLQQWTESKGIYELGEITSDGPTPGSFLEHCKKVEEKMWNKRWPIYTQWRKDIVDFYQNYGYIENHFGFRFRGYMNRNQCTNFPIQSASFHILVYTLIEVQKFIDKHKLKTKISGQVHDSIISNVPRDEIKFYHAEVNKIVKNLKNVFPWLIIPMKIEAEISKLREDGGNFAELKEVNPDDAKLWYDKAA